MSLDNYFNPNAFAPQQGGGMLMANGLDYVRDRQRFDYMANLQRQLVELELQKQNEEQKEGYGARTAKRGFEEADYGYRGQTQRARSSMPGYIPQILQGEMADSRDKVTTADFNQQTLPGRVAEKNATADLNSFSSRLQQVHAMGRQSPMMGQAAWQEFRNSMPENMRSQLPMTYSQEWVDHAMTGLMDTPKQRGDMAGKAEDYRRQQYASDRTLEGVKYAADARLEAAWAKFGGAKTQQKVENVIHQYLSMKMEGKQTTPQQDQVFQAAQQIMYNVRAAAGVAYDSQAGMMQQIFPNAPVPTRPVPSPVAPPGQQPQPEPAPQPTQLKPADQSQAVRAFGTYEPEKYDYLVGPDGRVGRRAKPAKK